MAASFGGLVAPVAEDCLDLGSEPGPAPSSEQDPILRIISDFNAFRHGLVKAADLLEEEFRNQDLLYKKTIPCDEVWWQTRRVGRHAGAETVLSIRAGGGVMLRSGLLLRGWLRGSVIRSVTFRFLRAVPDASVCYIGGV